MNYENRYILTHNNLEYRVIYKEDYSKHNNNNSSTNYCNYISDFDDFSYGAISSLSGMELIENLSISMIANCGFVIFDVVFRSAFLLCSFVSWSRYKSLNS